MADLGTRARQAMAIVVAVALPLAGAGWTALLWLRWVLLPEDSLSQGLGLAIGGFLVGLAASRVGFYAGRRWLRRGPS